MAEIIKMNWITPRKKCDSSFMDEASWLTMSRQWADILLLVFVDYWGTLLFTNSFSVLLLVSFVDACNSLFLSYKNILHLYNFAKWPWMRWNKQIRNYDLRATKYLSLCDFISLTKMEWYFMLVMLIYNFKMNACERNNDYIGEPKAKSRWQIINTWH